MKEKVSTEPNKSQTPKETIKLGDDKLDDVYDEKVYLEDHELYSLRTGSVIN